MKKRSDNQSSILRPGQTFVHRDKKYKILRQIWLGPFSEVMIVKEAGGNGQFAMKIEKTKDPQRSVLKLDVFVLREFQKTKAIGIPQLIAHGCTSQIKYVIMQLLGPDLDKLRRSLPGKKFTLTTALRLSIQTLDRIETLHDMGWLSRDIKANNFVIGLKDESQTVYILDFGFARRFRDKGGKFFQPRSSAALIGSIYYSSLAAHAFKDQCRRDDIESWFYMVCEFIKGSLPWAYANVREDYLLIGEWKRYARFSGRYELLKGVPEEFDKILEMIDNIKYFERPDYRTFRRLINNIFVRLKLNQSTPFEWETNPSLIQRASVIGDQGQSCFVSYRLRELIKQSDPMIFLP
uniref:Protein kinase domain-containing protein n=1 Tax=Elaeophora elaphi TaxID=1147741 RepID=A0A0R3RRB6_9BILA